MRTKLLLTAIVSSFLIQHSACAQGSLTPPAGAPTATMRSLDQLYNRLDTRTPISSVPFTISAAGSYYLTTNVNCTASNAIVIAVNSVTLDLNGFTINSTVANATNGGTAILLTSGLSDISIANGHIRGGVTNNGSGVYGGSGFGNGIFYSGISPKNVLISRVTVTGCQFNGIRLNYGDATVVEACTVGTIGTAGINASTIKQSSAIDCSGNAVFGDQVSDCRGESSGSGTGIDATTANNCYGSSSSGFGVNTITAQNCYGGSLTGTGLSANTANNSYGISSTSHGLTSTIANNCIGSSLGNGIGLNASSVATGCSGSSSSGAGLSAFIANGCRGQSASPALNLVVTHNVNSF